ncbi:MAG: hypothetical protein KAW14_14820 [Candidatus Aegiribacteria sp.]|nr:hypothetical protein [Candidatus Aegiribacteria sp.]
MRQIISASVLTCILFTAACIFGDSDPDYTDSQRLYKKSVGEIVVELFDNGYYVNDILLEPWEFSQDGFYIVESPDMLDSVFENIGYSGDSVPRLEDLFPEGGSLLIFSKRYLNIGDKILEHQISADLDTIVVDMTVRDWPGPQEPGNCSTVVFPIGFI